MPSSKRIVSDIYQGMSNPPLYFSIEDGSMSSVATRDKLYWKIGERLNGYASLVIAKYDRPFISDIVSNCHFNEPDPYAGKEAIAGVASGFFSCYERTVQKNTPQIAARLQEAGDSAYMLAVVFWGTQWKAERRTGWDVPMGHWYFTQVFLVSDDGRLYKSPSQDFRYGYGYEQEAEQRNPAPFLFPEVADQLVSQTRPVLSRLNAQNR